MKAVKIAIAAAIGILLAAGLGTTAFAFHSGGVAECGGCHSMHSPKDPSGGFLLQGSDASSTCLSCHGKADTAPTSYHVMTYPAPAAGSAPVERTPGGDFAWLLKSYTFTVRGTVTNEAGQSHGHNIIAKDQGLSVDTDFTTAPGGTFPSSQLGCNSCHNPHGKYRILGNGTVAKTGAPIMGSGSYNNSSAPSTSPNYAVGVYRLLQSGDETGTVGVSFPGAPIAVAPSTYNQTEATNQVRVAYGSGSTNFVTWGQWCSACHPDMHSSGTYVHPVDENLGSLAGNYNSYISSGNTTGTSGSAYLSLAPFAEGTEDLATLKSHASNTNAYLSGPATTDKVMCLSCHRAHATGWPDMLRWNYETDFLTYVDNTGAAVWPGTDTTPASTQFARGRTSTETAAAYYDRPVTVFGAYQRQLCNKCHAQD